MKKGELREKVISVCHNSSFQISLCDATLHVVYHPTLSLQLRLVLPSRLLLLQFYLNRRRVNLLIGRIAGRRQDNCFLVGMLWGYFRLATGHNLKIVMFCQISRLFGTLQDEIIM